MNLLIFILSKSVLETIKRSIICWCMFFISVSKGKMVVHFRACFYRKAISLNVLKMKNGDKRS